MNDCVHHFPSGASVTHSLDILCVVALKDYDRAAYDAWLGCDHHYRLVITRMVMRPALPPGHPSRDRVGLEAWTGNPPLYSFRCKECGDKRDVTWIKAAELGWVEIIDVP